MNHDEAFLDVGGQTFRTSKTTLRQGSGFFADLAERTRDNKFRPCGSESNPIFIDRDPLTFSATLSFLRSGKVPLLASLDSEFLEQWLVEANFYQLESLSKAVSEELALRRSHPVYPPMNALRFKAVHDSVVNQYFERGWAFVTSYRGSQTNICLVTGDTAHWNFYTNECTGCAGQMLSYEDFSKHCSQHENSMMVICKQLSQADEEADDLESLSEELLSDDRTSKRLSKRLSARLPFISSTTRLW